MDGPGATVGAQSLLQGFSISKLEAEYISVEPRNVIRDCLIDRWNYVLSHAAPDLSQNKCPIFEVSGPKNYTFNGFGTRVLRYLVLGPLGLFWLL